MAAQSKTGSISGTTKTGAAQPVSPPELKAVAADAGQPAAAKARVRSRDARQSRMAQAFSQVVAVLMRDPSFRNLRIADLEWLVIPPIMSGQFRLAHAQPSDAGKGAPFVPVSVALWARVSPEIDKHLSESLDQQVWLRPSQWASGDILWLMAVAGDRRAAPRFIQNLRETEFKGKPVKLRTRDADGKVQLRVLEPATPPPAPHAPAAQ
ncbi:MAG: toxin-activating lysine-acyltransferase [Hyphomicrobiaceae bacterium]|nr:toxin-activating lysine-acyltransferase [Hyphomicrobiaceae bacterium]